MACSWIALENKRGTTHDAAGKNGGRHVPQHTPNVPVTCQSTTVPTPENLTLPSPKANCAPPRCDDLKPTSVFRLQERWQKSGELSWYELRVAA
jgi:hypothetical protein